MFPVQLLFPCDITHPRLPDPAYVEEYDAAMLAGIPCALFSFEDLEQGAFKPRPTLAEGVQVVYRGWMMRPEQYAVLERGVIAQKASLLTDLRDYQRSHYLPGWYDACQEFTPETHCFTEEDLAMIPSFMREIGWKGCFVKDHVKSLTTQRGSVAHSLEDIEDIVRQLRNYRGDIEGGICLRELEDLRPETERRCFVVDGEVYGNATAGPVPALAGIIADRHDSPFYSLDIIQNGQGEWRLVEIGDGQVSSRKEWDADEFIGLFAAPDSNEDGQE